MVEFIGDQLGQPDYGDMMNRIYALSKPNRELASIAGQVLKKPYPEELNDVLRNAFSDFIHNQLSTLQLSKKEKIIFTGKVAEVHRKLLTEVLNEYGYHNVDVSYSVIAAWRARLKEERNF